MKNTYTKNQKDFILRDIINKYQANPERFRSYLPDIAQEIERLLPSVTKQGHTSSLTDLEREHLIKAQIQLLDKKEITQVEAVKALEYCATLIQDESLPYEVDRKTLLTLLNKVAGVSISKVKKTTKFPISEGQPIKEIAILSGVYLHLTWNDRLVAISVSPTKAKKRSQALKFVGIARDSASDVAQHHDIYLSDGV